MTGKTMIGLFAGAVAVGFWAKKKKDDYMEVVTQMGLDISNIHNLRTKNLKVYLDCDITFINNTNLDFMPITAGLITVKRVTIKSSGKVVGNAFSNTSQFSLPAKGSQKISNVSVELVSLAVIDQINNNTFSTNPANYTIEVEIFALGQTIIVEQ